MKKRIFIPLILALTCALAFGHGEIEIGPNKGRILEFSKDESMHGEVVRKEDKLHIILLDKNMKPVEISKQTLSVTAGTRQKPEKLEVTVIEGGFAIPEPAGGQWIILQFKLDPAAKPITARLHYDTTVCGDCKNPEWLCSCE
jgi:hypothetical protein